jgi:hypothetical protein
MKQGEEEGELEFVEMDSEAEKKIASCLCICCGSVNIYTKAPPPSREGEEDEGVLTQPPAQVMKDKEDNRKNKGKESLQRRKVLGLL